jgi:tagatose 1,6-diphosphate aldolase
MFTPAEQRALDQLSSPAHRLAVLAADQRTKLRAALAAAGRPADAATMRDFKLELARALSPVAEAVLLDPEIALPQAVQTRAVGPRTGLIVSLERSGSQTTPDSLRRAVLLPGVGAAGVRSLGGTAAKLLVRLRADREGTDGANAAVIRSAVADCAAHSLLLVVEVLVFRLADEAVETFAARRADLIREGALLAEACGARLLKLEYPGDEAACARATDALTVPWALLSAGVDHETFAGQLRRALHGGAAGFIAGRSIWQEAVAMNPPQRTAFLAGTARRRLEELRAIAA